MAANNGKIISEKQIGISVILRRCVQMEYVTAVLLVLSLLLLVLYMMLRNKLKKLEKRI